LALSAPNRQNLSPELSRPGSAIYLESFYWQLNGLNSILNLS
jgi:hypothetical protein